MSITAYPPFNQRMYAFSQLQTRLAAQVHERDLLREALTGVHALLPLSHITCYERHEEHDHWVALQTTNPAQEIGQTADSETAVLFTRALQPTPHVLLEPAAAGASDGAPSGGTQRFVVPLHCQQQLLGVLTGQTANPTPPNDLDELRLFLQLFSQGLATLWYALRLKEKSRQQTQEAALLQNQRIDQLWRASQAMFQARYTQNGFELQTAHEKEGAWMQEEAGENGRYLPLRLGETPFGVLTLPNQPINNEQLALVQALMREMGNALNNAYLLQTTRIHANQLALATEVSRAATTILDRHLLIQEVVNLIRSRFNLYYVGLFLVDEASNMAVLQAGTGEAGRLQVERGHRLAIGGPSMIGTAVAQGKAIVEQDVRQAKAFTYNPLLPHTRAELALPLRTRGRIIGALTVQNTTRYSFSEDTVAVLQNLADQLAIAIETATLFAQTQATLAETSRLYHAGQRISAARSPQEIYEAIITFSSQSEIADAAQILINDPTEPEFFLSPALWSRIPITDEAPARYPRRFLQTSQQLLQHRLAIIADTQTDPRLDKGLRDWFANNGFRACALITFTLDNEWLGTLALHSQQVNSFSEAALRPFLTLTDQAIVALANQRLLREVQEANEQLRQLDQLKTQFLANMSHELRTPLNSIIGFSRVMLKRIDGPITPEQEEDLTSIYNNGQHLLRLINEILDMAKIEAGKMVLTFEEVNLTEIAQGALNTIRSLTQEKGLQLYTDIEPDLPPIEADPVRLRQILHNLLSNAVKYTDQGHIWLRIQREGEEHVRITVSDTGIGISQNDFDKLFAAFEQVDNSATRTVGGTGLGLPITRWLVIMHQGSIDVESEVGRGSTFHVVLPLRQGETSAAEVTFAESLQGSL